MEIVAQLLGIKMRHNFIEDFGGAILDRANHAEQHPAGDPAPGAIANPRLAFEALVACDLTGAQRPGGQARALGFAPPAGSRQGKTPQDRLILVEENNLATAGPLLQGGECE